MLKSTKIILITATALLVGGIGITGAAYAFSGFDPHIFLIRTRSAEAYERKTADIAEDFRNIYVDCKTEDIKFLTSTDGKVKVEYSDCDKFTHNVAVSGDSLRISAEDERTWSFIFGFTTALDGEDNPKLYHPIYVYLPDGKEYGDISVHFTTGDILSSTKLVCDKFEAKLTTGDIHADDIEAKTVDASGTTGDIKLGNIKADEIKAVLTTGDIKLENTEADSTDLSINTGDLTLDSAGKGNLKLDITTGDIKLNNVEATISSISGKTGDVILNSYKADDTVISLTTGDVQGTVTGDYQYKTKNNIGDIEVPDSAGEAKMDISVKTGEIDISKR